MAQTVAVVRGTLSATSAGTTDFTKASFGTPTAAIIIVCNADSTNNPADNASLSVGFWDGTSQRCCAFRTLDAGATSSTHRASDDSYGALPGSTTSLNAYTVSAITDGIRLTLSVDNTSTTRYCTVILLAGVSAKALTFTTNTTQNGTQASASLGFAPTAAFFATVGAGSIDQATTAANMSFGFATSSGTHRMIGAGYADGAADEAGTLLYSETRCVGQISGGATVWTGEITTWGVDTFTMTTRDGSSAADVCIVLALGGADLSFDAGTLTTPTSTGNSVISTTVAPAAVLSMLSTATGTTLATDSQTNGVAVGLADASGQFAHNTFVEDAAATMNSGSAAQAAAFIDLDTSSGGARADMCSGTVTLNSSDFTINYSAVDGTARKGWWFAFGPAASASSALSTAGAAVGTLATATRKASDLSGTGAAVGTLATANTITAVLSGTAAALGTLASASAVTANLAATGAATGILVSVSTVAAALSSAGAAVGTLEGADGNQTGSAALSTVAAAVGTLAARADVYSALSATGVAVGTLEGSAVNNAVTADLSTAGVAVGTLSASLTVVADLSSAGRSTARLAGSTAETVANTDYLTWGAHARRRRIEIEDDDEEVLAMVATLLPKLRRGFRHDITYR